MLNKRSTILIIGSGQIAARHRSAIEALKMGVEFRDVSTRDFLEDPKKFLVPIENLLGSVVCAPASHHLECARVLSDALVPMLLEKPLASKLEDARQICQLSLETQVPILLGYCLRFDPLLSAARSVLERGELGVLRHVSASVGQHLELWRPGFDWTKSVSANPKLGGGALLELSHELDYVRWTAGSIKKLSTIFVGSWLDLEVEDTADLSVQFQSGATGLIHVDMIDRSPHRNCRWVGSKATMAWDGTKKTLVVSGGNSTVNLGEELLSKVEQENMYVAQMRHFFEVLEGHVAPAVPVTDGYEVLELLAGASRSPRS